MIYNASPSLRELEHKPWRELLPYKDAAAANEAITPIHEISAAQCRASGLSFSTTVNSITEPLLATSRRTNQKKKENRKTAAQQKTTAFRKLPYPESKFTETVSRQEN